jgi:hypothetical protein
LTGGSFSCLLRNKPVKQKIFMSLLPVFFLPEKVVRDPLTDDRIKYRLAYYEFAGLLYRKKKKLTV